MQLRYLNTILTILAVLLTLNLWTAWTTTSGGDAMSLTGRADAQGITNAGAQRQQMIDLLKKTNTRLGQMHTLLASGELKVQVAEAPEENDAESTPVPPGGGGTQPGAK